MGFNVPFQPQSPVQEQEVGSAERGADRRLVTAARVASYLMGALMVWPFFYHLAHHSDFYLAILPDDFYYYGVVADRLVRTGAGRVATGARARWLIAAAGFAVGLGVAGRLAYSRSLGFVPSSCSFYHHAKRIVAETGSLDGIFAMGDRAGMTAFAMHKPIVQLEGLAADRAMVEHIRRQDELGGVLGGYGVDYLIVTVNAPLERQGSCYRVMAPHPRQAGLTSPRMTGIFCDPPVVEFHTTDGNAGLEAYTYIFPVSARARRQAVHASASVEPR